MKVSKELTIDDVAKNVRMVVHGGLDYYDEKPSFFAQGHPILSIEMANEIIHFKCTSTDFKTHKTSVIQDGCYMFKDPYYCQLNKTSKAVYGNSFNPIVDLNHSVYLVNNETPPLVIHLNKRHSTTQTQFNLSQRDKIGVLSQLIYNVDKYGYIRKPYVTEDEIKNADKMWNKQHPQHKPHSVQVASQPILKLQLDDLQLNKIIADKLFE